MKPLIAEQLRADPRVAEARRLLAAAAEDHARTLTGIRAAYAERKISYDDLLTSFGEARAGKLFYPFLGSGIGRGAFVELADGSVKYDLISGIGVHHFGHSSPLLRDALLDAALSDTVMQGNLQQNVEAAELTRALLDLAAPGTALKHCFLSSSGAMANENALKLAFHKKPGATRILAFEHCFAGRTLALAQITDKAAYRVGLPAILPVDYVPFFDSTQPADSTARAVASLEHYLERYPGQHAAMWFELVLGEGGFHVGDRAFFELLMKMLRQHKVAIVIDEVQTFGRTSRPFAFQHFGLEAYADIVTVGKMLQACATLFTSDFRPGPGLISQTFTASTSALLCGRAIVRELAGGAYFGEAGRNLQVHRRFVERFTAIAARHPALLRGPHGLGGMIAMTLIDGSEETAKAVLHEMFARGVVAFYNGAAPTRVRFLPPIGALTDADIDAVCDVLEASLTAVAAKRGVAP